MPVSEPVQRAQSLDKFAPVATASIGNRLLGRQPIGAERDGRDHDVYRTDAAMAGQSAIETKVERNAPITAVAKAP